jgi:hypothetical protein
VFLAALVLAWYSILMLHAYQFDIIYDRVGDMQQQLECPPTEAYVTDLDGNEYCVDVADQQKGASP